MLLLSFLFAQDLLKLSN